MPDDTLTTKPLTTAGVVLGVGMGGFLDGIVFHQILQLHNMLSARIPADTLAGAKTNMVWDGLFHAMVWIATAAGILLLWRAVKRPDVLLSGRGLFGSTLLGFGLFNLVEGIVDHHVVNLHHVYERLGSSIWDYVFLASGVALILTGWLMIRDVRSIPIGKSSSGGPAPITRCSTRERRFLKRPTNPCAGLSMKPGQSRPFSRTLSRALTVLEIARLFILVANHRAA